MACGDDGDFDTVGAQALEAKSVVDVESLQLASMVAVDQLAVGENTVDVEYGQFYFCSAATQFGTQIVKGGGGHTVVQRRNSDHARAQEIVDVERTDDA